MELAQKTLTDYGRSSKVFLTATLETNELNFSRIAHLVLL